MALQTWKKKRLLHLKITQFEIRKIIFPNLHCLGFKMLISQGFLSKMNNFQITLSYSQWIAGTSSTRLGKGWRHGMALSSLQNIALSGSRKQSRKESNLCDYVEIWYQIQHVDIRFQRFVTLKIVGNMHNICPTILWVTWRIPKKRHQNSRSQDQAKVLAGIPNITLAIMFLDFWLGHILQAKHDQNLPKISLWVPGCFLNQFLLSNPLFP